MKKSLLNLRNIVVAAVILLALLSRLTGLGFGLPYTYHVDEDRFAEISLRYFSGDLNPHFFHVPSLYTYMVAGVWGSYYLSGKLLGTFGSRSDFINAYYESSVPYLLLGRLLTALLGVLTVYLLFLIGRDMFNFRVGVLAALFLAFSLEHVKTSHYMVPDGTMVFFLVLSFLFVWRILTHGRTSDYILAGLFAGLAYATKYGGHFLFIPLFLAHLFRTRETRQPLWALFFSPKLILAVVVFVAGFLIGCPYAVLDSSRFWSDFRWQSQHLFRTGHLGTSESTPAWLFYILYGFKDNVGALSQWLVLGGVAYGLARHRKKDILLLSVPVLLFPLIGTMKTYATRYLLPIIPFFILAAAVFLDASAAWFTSFLRKTIPSPRMVQRLGGVLLALVVAVFMTSPLVRVVRYDTLMTETDTRTEAKNWIHEHIPRNARIATEIYGPPVSPKLYDVVHVHGLSNRDLEWLAQRKVEYISVNDIMSARFTRYPEEFPREAAFYRSLDEQAVLIKTFQPRWDDYLIDLHNPTIKIYKLSSAPNFAFPGNFVQFSQEILLTMTGRREWKMTSALRVKDMTAAGERLRDPYIRITDKQGREIFRWVLRKGEFPDGVEFLSGSTELRPVPGDFRVYAGYEYSLSPNPWTFQPESPMRKEYLLAERSESSTLSKDMIHVYLFYTQFPGTRGDFYFQVATLARLASGWDVYSKVFGYKIRHGQCYLVDPFLKITDASGREVLSLALHEGRVGTVEADRRAPVRKRTFLPSLPEGFRVLMGYEYFFDTRHPDRAGGPETLEIISPRRP